MSTIELEELIAIETLLVDQVVLVTVEPEHIKRGMVNSPKFNAISLAVKDMLLGRHKVEVFNECLAIDNIPFNMPITACVGLKRIYRKRQEEALTFHITVSPDVYQLLKPQFKS